MNPSQHHRPMPWTLGLGLALLALSLPWAVSSATTSAPPASTSRPPPPPPSSPPPAVIPDKPKESVQVDTAQKTIFENRAALRTKYVNCGHEMFDEQVLCTQKVTTVYKQYAPNFIKLKEFKRDFEQLIKYPSIKLKNKIGSTCCANQMYIECVSAYARDGCSIENTLEYLDFLGQQYTEIYQRCENYSSFLGAKCFVQMGLTDMFTTTTTTVAPKNRNAQNDIAKRTMHARTFFNSASKFGGGGGGSGWFGLEFHWFVGCALWIVLGLLSY